MELIEKTNVYNNKIVKTYYINGVSVSTEDYGDSLEACENEVDEDCNSCDCCQEYPEYIEEMLDDCIEMITNSAGICGDCFKSILHSLYMEGYKEGSIDARLELIDQLSDAIEGIEEDE